MKNKYLDKQLVELSLAEHLFFAQEYEKALDLNLRIGERLYDLFDFDSALQFAERAEICAEKTKNRDKLASSLHQKGSVLQSMFRFSEAFESYNQSMEIEKEIGNRAGEAQTLTSDRKGLPAHKSLPRSTGEIQPEPRDRKGDRG